ncbi:formate dehydrogenase accessory sulfurtransferase FdhD [Desulfolutivibrio sp.]|uniref:formate dehydrogenase accessory sulfurtransferase FdhD n=1 Tax=Desulfolutivibrio sp. TaxID=2773296 RepID=UPI002F96D06B
MPTRPGASIESVVASLPCRRYRDGAVAHIDDDIAIEVGIEVGCGPGPARRLFAAPLDLDILALGHAWLEMCPAGHVPAPMGKDVAPDARRFVFEAVPAPSRNMPEPDGGRLSAGQVVSLMRRFIAAPGLWDGTGCFHRAAAYDPDTGEFPFQAEDIGRHNCLDRLCGQAHLADKSLSGLVLFLSARFTASMCDKALRAGFRTVVSRSAVTTEAVRLAQEGGLSLAGFVREAENRCTVFCDAAGRFVL